MLLGSDHGNVASAKAPPFPAGSAATEEQPPQALWLKRRWGSGTKSTGGGMHGRFVYPCGFEYFPYNVEFGPVVRCQHPHPGPSWLRALQTLPRPVCSPPSASPPSTPSRPPRRRRAATPRRRRREARHAFPRRRTCLPIRGDKCVWQDKGADVRRGSKKIQQACKNISGNLCSRTAFAQGKSSGQSKGL